MTKKLFIVIGPARLVNYNCNPNARFARSGENSLNMIAIRDILMGFKITIDYRHGYFVKRDCRYKSYFSEPNTEFVLNSDNVKDFSHSRRRLRRVFKDKELRVFAGDDFKVPVLYDTC
jgi:hypothetical protein